LSDIRVTYSGLIAFVVGLISVFTGLLFTLTVTRQLSPEEFGTWAIIGSMIMYFLVTERIVSFWTLRQIARNELVGKTAIITSSSFSLGAIPAYLLLVYIVSGQSNVDPNIMMFGAILIPVQFINQTFNSINLAHKPHATSIALLAFESFKVPGGLVLVYFLDLGLQGAIMAVFFAYVGRIAVHAYFAKPKIKDKFTFVVIRRWFKLAWLSIYSQLTYNIWSVDVVIYTIITGSVIGIAYYSASMVVATILVHAGIISQALYPKLLAQGSHKQISKTFRLLMYFAIPLLGISLVFSRPALFALNPQYEIASMIVIILSFKTFFLLLRNALDGTLLGIERIDVNQNLVFSKYLKSKLFFVPTRKFVHFGLYISILVITLLILNSNETSELELVTWWATLALSMEIPFVIYLYLQVKKYTKFSFPYIDTGKYIASTLLFILVFFLLSDSIIQYEISIFKFLPGLFLQLAICIGIYLIITYVIDKKTRILFKTIYDELILKKQ